MKLAVGILLAFVVGCGLDVGAWLVFGLLASRPPMPPLPVLCAGVFVPMVALSFAFGAAALAMFDRHPAPLAALLAPHVLVVAVLGAGLIPFTTHALSAGDRVGAWAIFACLAFSIPAGLVLAWKFAGRRAGPRAEPSAVPFASGATVEPEPEPEPEPELESQPADRESRMPKRAWVLVGVVVVLVAVVLVRGHDESPEQIAWREYLTVIQRDDHPMSDTERLQRIDRAIALDPKKSSYHAKRADLLVSLGRLAEARAALTRTLALAPDFAAARMRRGQLACELRDYAQAIADFDVLLAARPGAPDVHGARAIALVGQGRVAEAGADLDRVLADPKLRSLDGHYERAVVRIAEGRGDLAIGELDRVIATQVADARYFWMRARAYEQTGDRLAARADRRRALDARSSLLCADPFSAPGSTAALADAVAAARNPGVHAVVLRAPYAEARSPAAGGAVARPLRVEAQGRGYAEVDLDREVSASSTSLDVLKAPAPPELTLVDAAGGRRGTLFGVHARCTSPCGGGAGMTCHAVATYVFGGPALDEHALAFADGDGLRVKAVTLRDRVVLEAPVASWSAGDFNDGRVVAMPTHRVVDADGRALYVGSARWREQTYPAILYRQRGWRHEWLAPTYPSVCERG